MSANHRPLLVVVAVFAVALALKSSWTPVRIQYHRNFVAASRNPLERPVRFRDYVSQSGLRWFLTGMPTSWQNLQVSGREHEDALIRMGYFDRRFYSFTNTSVGRFGTEVRAESLRDRLCFMRGLQGGVEVVA